MTDRTVAACLADGARTLEDLAARCGAGERCGGCHPALADLVAQAEAKLLLRARAHAAA